MNTSILVRTYLKESRLVERVLAMPRSTHVLRDLDECIAHTVRNLKVKGRKHPDVLKGPGVLTGDSYPKAFLAVWKSRATETVKMIDRFLSEQDGQRKSVLYRNLTQRFFHLPAPQPVRARYKIELTAESELRVPTAAD